MPRFTVAHNYRSNTASFDANHEVEVDEATAEWVNRDSPGTLVPVAQKPAPTPEPSDDGDDEAKPAPRKKRGAR